MKTYRVNKAVHLGALIKARRLQWQNEVQNTRADPKEKLAARREFTVRGLAAQAGVHPTMLSKIERGVLWPGFSTLIKILDSLELALQLGATPGALDMPEISKRSKKREDKSDV